VLLSLKQSVKKAEGVRDARLNFGASKITVHGRKLTVAEVNRLGAFDGIRVAEEEESAAQGWKRRLGDRQTVFTGVSALLIAASWMGGRLGAGNWMTVGLLLLGDHSEKCPQIFDAA
jgi:Zn2+/Cd2+-exporting ATPase